MPWDIPSCDSPHAESRHSRARREAGLGAGSFLLSGNLSPTFPALILGESAVCEGRGKHSGTWCVPFCLGPKVFCCLPSIQTHSCGCCLILSPRYFSCSPPGRWFPHPLPYGLEAAGLVLVWGMLASHLLASDHLLSPQPQSEREINVTAAFPCIHSAVLKGGSQPAVCGPAFNGTPRQVPSAIAFGSEPLNSSINRGKV